MISRSGRVVPSRGNARIELHQILQRDADAAQPHRQSRHFVLGQHQIAAGLLQPRRQPAGADPVQQRDRRHVQRQLQRLAHRHRALKRHVEILRRVIAEPGRPIVDQAFRMNETVLEGEPIDERLQGRSRRAHRAGHVDLPCPVVVEIIRRADARQHVAAFIVDGDDADGNFGPSAVARSRASASRFFCRLESSVSEITGSVLEVRDRPIGGMRRQDRDRLAHPRHRHGLRCCRRPRSMIRPSSTMRSSTRSRAARAAPGWRSSRRFSGDCGSATSSAASASDSRFGSLPK